jgi:septum formation protein
VIPSRIAEPPYRGDNPADYALQLAGAKGREVSETYPGAVVISADTIVVVDKTVLGKPRNNAEAFRMLGLLQGRGHEVITGVCVYRGDPLFCAEHSEVTRVFFRTPKKIEIEAYIRTGEPADKAGAYGIQGRGALLVERIEGCYSNVVGLPLSALGLMLRQVGIDMLGGEYYGNHLPNDSGPSGGAMAVFRRGRTIL